MSIFLKPSEVAPLLGVTSNRVYDFIRNGALPHIRRGRAILVPRGAFDDWVRDREAEARAAVRPPADDAA